MTVWHWIEEGAAPGGFRAAGVRAGLKTEGPDLALIVADGEPRGAAVFTRSQFSAPPVLLSREHAAGGRISAIIANSGCANACTGEAGLADAREMARLAADCLGLAPEQILVASTGIIGHPLRMDLLRAAVPAAVGALDRDGLPNAALAIMTTDTSPKQAALAVEIEGAVVTISGMVKGAGMIAPRMATAFGFFMTDAVVEGAPLAEMFTRIMDRSLNRVTVDGDTSTNDTACILASGASGCHITPGTDAAAAFEEALGALAEHLARRLAREGEGATHLLTIHVVGALTDGDAETIALSIANSPLVKTAIFGRDPNWGRIAMAAGKAGVPFHQETVDIDLNGIAVMRAGGRVDFDEEKMRESLLHDEIVILLHLHQGSARATTWTCDFSYEYVEINAEYHT